jgi:hypothetical protein
MHCQTADQCIRLPCMVTIVYKKTKFTAPAKISEATYLHYKKLLAEDADLRLIDDPQRFTSRFKRTLKNLSWILPLFALLSLGFAYFFQIPATSPDPVRITIFIVILILGMMALGLLIRLLLEGRSYATFLKDRSAYFHQMKVAISNSPDYPNFYHGFYSGGIRHSVPPEAKQPFSADRLLTDVFHLMDRYWWIVALLVFTLFFGKKIFFRD